jgi:hypothetical protein
VPSPSQARLSSTADVARLAFESMPGIRRLIVSLRDIDQCSAFEVGQALRIDIAVQRTELHGAPTELLRSPSHCERASR